DLHGHGKDATLGLERARDARAALQAALEALDEGVPLGVLVAVGEDAPDALEGGVDVDGVDNLRHGGGTIAVGPRAAMFAAMARRSESPGPCYSERLDEALRFAAEQFRFRVRKGSGVPYLTHLLQVCCTVGEHGGDEDQMVAA